MAHLNFPKGAGLGHDPNKQQPTPIDYEWVMQFGSRAQRREILRHAKQHQRHGIEGAAVLAAELEAREKRSDQWIVSLPGSAPFTVLWPHKARAAEILARYPGATVQARDAK